MTERIINSVIAHAMNLAKEYGVSTSTVKEASLKLLDIYHMEIEEGRFLTDVAPGVLRDIGVIITYRDRASEEALATAIAMAALIDVVQEAYEGRL